MQDPLPIQPLDGPFELTLDDLPGSKSLTNRALLLAALAEGTSTLGNVLLSDDTRVMIEALEALGFDLKVDESAATVTIEGRAGRIPNASAELHLGNAGTAMRFLTAACCLGSGPYALDGVPRMRQRPIGHLVDVLRRLGADIAYLGEEGYPPLRIGGGRLAGGAVTMPATVSSQYVSALLQVAPFCDGALELTFDSPVVSLPYVRMTVELMRRWRAWVRHDPEFRRIRVEHRPYTGGEEEIEPDASNASYFLAAAAIRPMSTCRIDKLGGESLQGDAAFARVLGQMGATVQQLDEQTWIKGPRKLRGVDVDLNEMPDMAQTLAVVALFAEGPTVIRNVGNLRVKETDRLAALDNELTKLGAAVEVDGDDLRITPPPGNEPTNAQAGRPLSWEDPVDIDTYDDHRMAMSFAVAGLRWAGIRINDPTCVNKTFPAFWTYLDRLRGSSARARRSG